MDISKRDFLTSIGASAVFAAVGLLVSRPSFAAGGNGGGNGNGNGGSKGNAGGSGNAGGNSGGNGNGNAGGNGNGGGKGNGSSKSDGGTGSSATSSAGTQAREGADGSIDVRHANGITESLHGGRYVMRDSKGRTIISRLATTADARRLSRLVR
ncbi:hypothetical protein ASC97_22210 [Rhizobium sp. Root1203]|jgi:hypothetical protein|uniref:hypothetical protein n=1 Tax=Rhizobium sp. Root1203 TaxID=1736427 RepID=UPI0007107465|nr:hypothetical protein [Rhizobium sp. Root1203]KQV30235.1 hypothetical protein ASC97_22210 [Rhizobium sp. Root1203]